MHSKFIQTSEYGSVLERGHPLSTYAKFPEKLTFLTPLIRTRACAYQGVRNVSFSENLAYVLNWWPKHVDYHSKLVDLKQDARDAIVWRLTHILQAFKSRSVNEMKKPKKAVLY